MICLLSIFVFDNLLYPAIKPGNLSQSASDKAEHVKTFFDLFWKFPIFLFCFWINVRPGFPVDSNPRSRSSSLGQLLSVTGFVVIPDLEKGVGSAVPNIETSADGSWSGQDKVSDSESQFNPGMWTPEFLIWNPSIASSTKFCHPCLVSS